MPYAPNRQLGLETAFRLVDEKKRFDVLSAARRRAMGHTPQASPDVGANNPAHVEGQRRILPAQKPHEATANAAASVIGEPA